MQAVYAKAPIPYRRLESLSLLHRGAEAVALNETGTKIWDLIDGKRTTEQLTSEFAKDYAPALHNSITAKLDQFLTTLYRLGIVKIAGDAPLLENIGAANGHTQGDGGGAPLEVKRGLDPMKSVCMTPKRDLRQALTASEKIEQLYWEKRYIQKMHLELTYRCNFRCVHCYNATHTGAETEMTTEEWCSALEQLADLGCHTVTFTGGEVFVRKDAPEIMQAACDHAFSILINTNGSLINELLLQKLEVMRPFLQIIEISFYGATPAVHDTLARRPGSYQSTLRALKLLMEARMPVLAKFITMRDNFDGIPRFKRDMQELGARHEVGAGLLIPKTNRDESPLVQILTDDQYKAMLETTNGAGAAESSEIGNCRPGYVRGAITPDGSVSPCEWLTDFKLGNLRQNSLREIWYSQPFLDFRKVLEEEPECHTCELRPGCQRCPAQSYLETGHLLHCAPVPNHYAELYQEYRKSHASREPHHV